MIDSSLSSISDTVDSTSSHIPTALLPSNGSKEEIPTVDEERKEEEEENNHLNPPSNKEIDQEEESEYEYYYEEEEEDGLGEIVENIGEMIFGYFPSSSKENQENEKIS